MKTSQPLANPLIVTDGVLKVKAETLVTAFTEKSSKLDGMPFHKAHNGITRPEIGASLAFVDRMASLAFQVRYLNEHRYIPELKRLLFSAIHKMFNIRQETARKYAALAIQEVCLSDICKRCEGRGVVSYKFRPRIRKKVGTDSKKWLDIEVSLKKGMELDMVMCIYSVEQSEVKSRLPWLFSNESQKVKEYEARKPQGVSYDRECVKCNGSGFGVMLDKERAEFLKVASCTYSNQHKEKYGQVYLHLRDALQSIKTH